MEETWEAEEKGRSWIEHDILTTHYSAQYFDRSLRKSVLESKDFTQEAENSRTHVQRRQTLVTTIANYKYTKAQKTVKDVKVTITQKITNDLQI